MKAFPKNRLGKRAHVALIGPTLCGKTNVAKWLMLIYWRRFGIRSLVLDPNPKQGWPSCALVFRDAEKFWSFVWSHEACAVFADEAGGTIGAKRDLTEVFTRIRQNDHVLHVMGHHSSNLTPEMREQIHTLFLFGISRKSAEKWAEEWADDRLLQATGLPQYEFVWAEKYGDKATRKNRVTHGYFPPFVE